MVDPSNPSDVERIMRDYIRKRTRPFDTNLGIISVENLHTSSLTDFITSRIAIVILS
jgi:hypothetical protein